MKNGELMSIKNKLLSDCSSGEVFWTTNGVLIRNIYELANFLKDVREEFFRYHVNLDNNKNDFADWIRDVFGDTELAERLEGVMDKSNYLKIIEKRIKELESLE